MQTQKLLLFLERIGRVEAGAWAPRLDANWLPLCTRGSCSLAYLWKLDERQSSDSSVKRGWCGSDFERELKQTRCCVGPGGLLFGACLIGLFAIVTEAAVTHRKMLMWVALRK